MKKSKIYYLVALFVLFITMNNCYKITVYADDKLNRNNPIAEIKDKNISLYYDKISDGMLKGFYLQSGDKIKYYDWESYKSWYPDYPKLNLIDNKYIAVDCLEAEGTGLLLEKLHLIDKTSLKEQTFTDPIDVIKSNVNIKIKAPYVTIKIKNNTWKTKVTTISSKHLHKSVCYGSVIEYDVKENYFTVSVPLDIAYSAPSMGDFNITYSWSNKMSKFIPTEINYIFNDLELRQ